MNMIYSLKSEKATGTLSVAFSILYSYRRQITYVPVILNSLLKVWGIMHILKVIIFGSKTLRVLGKAASKTTILLVALPHSLHSRKKTPSFTELLK